MITSSRLRPSLMRSRPSRRRGFTLVELLVAMVLLAVVGLVIINVLRQQQRFYRSEADIINTRRQLREAASLIPGDIREMSTAGPGARNDVYAMSDSSIDLRSTFGSSIVCQITDLSHVVIPPTALKRKNGLASWLRQPVAGDSMFVFDDSGGTASRGMWRRYQLTTITPTVGACPATTNYTQAADSTQNSYVLAFTPNLTATMIAGAPIRFYSHVHYALYLASDGNTYAGYYNCNPNSTPTCPAMETIAGPFLPYDDPATGRSGLNFAYFDSLGNSTTLTNEIARVRMQVRGQTALPVTLSNSTPVILGDSLRLDVAIRNRF